MITKTISSYDRGYLNAAMKLNLGGAFTLEFDVQNILRNAKRDYSRRRNRKKRTGPTN